MRRAAVFTFLISLSTLGISGDSSRGLVVSPADVPARVNDPGTAEVRMMLSGDKAPDAEMYAGTGEFQPGARLPEHSHDSSTELVYVLSGAGELVLDGQKRNVRSGDLIYIPSGVLHSFHNTGAEPVRIFQVYSPPGPEERFQTWRIKTESE